MLMVSCKLCSQSFAGCCVHAICRLVSWHLTPTASHFNMRTSASKHTLYYFTLCSDQGCVRCASLPYTGVEAASQQAAQQQLPLSARVDEGHKQANHRPDQLAAAIQKAEALLAEVHAVAVQALSSPGAADNKLLVKQLRLQRNQAFETAKALLNRAAAGT